MHGSYPFTIIPVTWQHEIVVIHIDSCRLQPSKANPKPVEGILLTRRMQRTISINTLVESLEFLKSITTLTQVTSYHDKAYLTLKWEPVQCLHLAVQLPGHASTSLQRAQRPSLTICWISCGRFRESCRQNHRSKHFQAPLFHTGWWFQPL